MQLICPRCQTINESDAHFCRICGTGFKVQPIRRNSISTPILVIIAVAVVCGFCGLFGLITGNKTDVAKSSNSPTAAASPTANSNADALPLRDLVETSDSTNTVKQKSNKTATVISENANLRKTADSNGEVIQTVPENAEIEVIRQKGAWFYVSASGQSGWMHGNTIRLAGGYTSKSPTETVGSAPSPTSSPKIAPKDFGDSDAASSSSSQYIRGSRGGCYYINRNGNKTYVDRSLCGGTDTGYKSSSSSSSSGGYIRGPRGGCYYYTASGRKQYVDRSLCN